VQQHPISNKQKYDVVLFHAVLEWLADPFGVLQQVMQFVKPGGALSLLFYNRHSVVLTNLLKGNFNKVESGELRGHKKSLTPINPILPEEVYTFLKNTGYPIEVISGVRVFNDYIPRAVRDERSVEDTIALEARFSREEPYRAIARYIHVIVRVPKV
jgi:S-adenosylmethionine-dependent methyltransferase